MTQTFYIFKKEFKAYFTSPLAYIFLVVFLSASNFAFFLHFFERGEASVHGLFQFMPWFFLFFLPAVTMRLWAEEKRQGALEFLLTMPVRDAEVVAGKYLACLLFLLVAIAMTIGMPLTAHLLTAEGQSLDWGVVGAAYLGTLLLGASYLAVGMFASSLTGNQIVAYIVGVVLCFGLFAVGEGIVADRAGPLVAPVLRSLGVGAHFIAMLRGVIDTRDIVYFISVIVFFLFLNGQSLAARSYR